MTQHIIAAVSPSFCKSKQLIEELKKLGAPLIVNETGKEFDPDALTKFLNDTKATIAIIGKEVISGSTVENLRYLRAIAKYGVGLDSLDVDLLAKHNIKLGHTPGVNRFEVAEHVLGIAIGHFRRLVASDKLMKLGIWEKNGGRSLSGIKVGIIGFGNVGTAVAEIFRFFSVEVFYTDIIDKAEIAKKIGAKQASRDDILAQCDLVTLHVPLTPVTRNLISSEDIKKLKDSALLINTSRGQIVDFDTAVRAVQSGKLGGFSTDVYTSEPVNLAHLLDNDNLYLTPHIAANSQEAILKMGRSAIEWVKHFLEKS